MEMCEECGEFFDLDECDFEDAAYLLEHGYCKCCYDNFHFGE